MLRAMRRRVGRLGRPSLSTTAAAAPAVPAEVVAAEWETPTARRLTLRPEAGRLAVSAGQWLELRPAGLDASGGFSVCSDPRDLQERGTVELLVRDAASFAPARWACRAAEPGDRVELRAGGTLRLCDEDEAAHGRAVFVAGGVGVSPLLAMLRERLRRGQGASALVYSVRTPAEEAFAAEIDALRAASGGALGVARTYTRPGGAAPPGARSGRVDAAMLREALAGEEGAPGTRVYLCGPPAMTDAMAALLEGPLGVPAARVRYESWWRPRV